MNGTDPNLPLTRDLVLLGGGHAHALVLRSWAMDPLPGARVTLINPGPVTAYTGMLPGLIAGHYTRDQTEIDLVQLARAAGARLIIGAADGIDRTARRVTVPDRCAVAYDVLSIDIGSHSGMPDLPGFGPHAVPVKPLGEFAARWQRFVDAAPGIGHAPRVAIIGGGVAGAELALACAHRLAALAPVITVIEAGPVPLAGLGQAARQRIMAAMARSGVILRPVQRVAEVLADAVVLATGEVIAADLVAGAAGARGHPWLGSSGLALTDGFIDVGPTLASVTDDVIFASGDCAHMAHAPRPKAGVFAVRAAPVLDYNLRATLSGGTLRAFYPQRRYLKLISTGDRQATADGWGLSPAGRWVWRWKDRIDRRFMGQFAALPVMAAVPLPPVAALGMAEAVGDSGPLCGGCGAKVGGTELAEVLAGVLAGMVAGARAGVDQGEAGGVTAAVSVDRTAAPDPPGRERTTVADQGRRRAFAPRADVLAGVGDDAAVLRHGTGVQVLTTDHLRVFCADPWLMARITAVHALGDIWAMGAAPQAALLQVILPRLSPRLQSRTLSEIMDAAAEVFGAAGAAIVGGHTSTGAELTIGFTLTGLCARATRLGGAVPGDVLILTKPLGTGVILAAEMRRAAPGRVVAGAWDSMQRPMAGDAAIMAPVARAMTDVTGFGLAGHLLAMLDACSPDNPAPGAPRSRAPRSGARSATCPVGAVLNLGALPLLAGAADLAVAGHRSSLYAANRSLAARIPDHPDPKSALIYDPQTAGGLLAAIPADAVDGVLAALACAGAPAAAIGRIVAGPAVITLG